MRTVPMRNGSYGSGTLPKTLRKSLLLVEWTRASQKRLPFIFSLVCTSILYRISRWGIMMAFESFLSRSLIILIWNYLNVPLVKKTRNSDLFIDIFIVVTVLCNFNTWIRIRISNTHPDQTTRLKANSYRSGLLRIRITILPASMEEKTNSTCPVPGPSISLPF